MRSQKSIDAVRDFAAHARSERAEIHGHYHFEFFDKDGVKQWEDDIENLVTTVGKNAALDAFLAGAAYTVTGPFLGLISSVGYGAGPAAGDTMASHAGWAEAGASTNYPLLTARLTMNGHWNAAAAGAKALTAALAFTIGATGGTVKGAFAVFGAGAVATLTDANGTLLSAGLFSGGDQVVSAGGTLNVSYTMSL
jgi:hypothetical protein